MIHEMGILASVVAALIISPYLLSPMQIWIGQFSDRHTIAGYRRTPYILLGVGLCIGGMLLMPHAAIAMSTVLWEGLGLGFLSFFMWGIGYNLAAVSYLSLTSDMAGANQRARTISIMWFMMIVNIIITAILIGHALDPYSNAKLVSVFNTVALGSVILVTLGLVGLEPRQQQHTTPTEIRHTNRAALAAVFGNPQTRLFFVYLILFLSSILAQDILLEPFGAQAFGMSVKQTTHLTAIWGTTTMIALLLQGFVLSKRISNRQGAFIGGILAAAGLFLIATSGLAHMRPIFIPGIALLGFGTGIATTTNLSLMLGMTTREQTGLFIGAWGVADALSRGMGNFMGGVGRDMIAFFSGSTTSGYVGVFLIEACMLCLSLLILRTIDVSGVRSEDTPSVTEVIALAGDA
jgi:BCD family chlorophyll transporter-like MFS transporter